jgi:hypothetical protein
MSTLQKPMMMLSVKNDELSGKSPSVSPPISSAFSPYPLFQWYLQSNEIWV